MKTSLKLNPNNGRRLSAGINDLLATGVKRIAYGLLAPALLLAACNEKEHDPDAQPSLAISPALETITFSAEGTESYTFEVTTNQPAWLPITDQEWCKVTMTPSTNTFTVTALPNYKDTPSTPATITVTAGKAAPLTITATQDGAQYDLYISGSYTEAGTEKPCYWKNGTLTLLPAVDETGYGSTTAMTVSNGKVYIAGRGEDTGCYWIDGVCHELKEYYGVQSIAVDNDAVYVLGGVSLLWKNGVLQDIDWADGFTPYALTVTEGTVNVAGRIHLEIPIANYSADLAACGTPKSPHQLSTPIVSNFSDALCVTSSAGSVYVGGYYDDKDARINRACFWRDKQPTTLEVPKDANDSSVKAICVENETVYSAGYCWSNERKMPIYWTNEKYTELPIPSDATEAEVTGIAAAAGTVYVSGIYRDKNYTDHACYWVNGEVKTLPKIADSSDQYTSGIALVRK